MSKIKSISVNAECWVIGQKTWPRWRAGGFRHGGLERRPGSRDGWVAGARNSFQGGECAVGALRVVGPVQAQPTKPTCFTINAGFSCHRL